MGWVKKPIPIEHGASRYISYLLCVDLIQPLAAVMTAPSFNNLTPLVTGWVFTPRRTVAGTIVAAQAIDSKHHSALHRFLAVLAPANRKASEATHACIGDAGQRSQHAVQQAGSDRKDARRSKHGLAA